MASLSRQSTWNPRYSKGARALATHKTDAERKTPSVRGPRAQTIRLSFGRFRGDLLMCTLTCGLGRLVSFLAVRLSGIGMHLRLFVFSLRNVMGGFTVVMGCRVVLGSGTLVLSTCWGLGRCCCGC